MKKILIPAIIGSFLFYQGRAFAQNTGINANGATPDVSAMLDVDVSSLGATSKKGLLIPRVALTSSTDGSTIPTPATSLMVYCTGTGGLSPAGYYYNSGTSGSPVWVQMLNGGSPGTAWMLAGNTNTNPGADFIGTTDAKDLQIKTAGVQRIYVRSGGVVNIVGDCGIGTTVAPVGRLEVDQGTGTSTGVNIQCNGNAAGTGTALNILKSGAPTGAFTSYGIQSSVTTTTNSTNVAGYFSATGGATANYAIIVPSGGGSVGVGTSAPVQQLEITGSFNMPVATGATVGMIRSGNTRFLYTCATNQTFLGLFSGNATLGNMTGNNNTGCGYSSLNGLTSGSRNTAIGLDALFTNSVASDNTAVGQAAMRGNTYAEKNVAVGEEALFTQSFANGSVVWNSENTAVGYRALYLNQPVANVSSGTWNTAVGSQALQNNTTGYECTAVGYHALAANTTARFNTAVGSQALQAATGVNTKYNTAVGYRALAVNNWTAGTESYNNTAIGLVTLEDNTKGSWNTALGSNALNHNIAGNANTALGEECLSNLTGASWNVAVGQGCMFGAASVGGNSNTAVGWGSMMNISTGANNATLGYQAGLTNVTGSNNTLIGYNANVGVDGLTNATAMGNSAVVNASNKVRIGNATVGVIEGQVAYTFPSDGRFKFNVQEEVKGLEFISKLRPVTYQFDTKKFDEFLVKNMPDSIKRMRREESPDYGPSTGIIHTGFIAQEVEKAAKECGFTFDGVSAPKDENGNYGVAYSQFVVPLVKSVQELNVRNEEQQKTIEELRKEIRDIRDLLYKK